MSNGFFKIECLRNSTLMLVLDFCLFTLKNVGFTKGRNSPGGCCATEPYYTLLPGSVCWMSAESWQREKYITQQVSERAKNRTTSTDEVADVEIALGRLGDEEDVLVQRLEERRFAAAMAESFK